MKESTAESQVGEGQWNICKLIDCLIIKMDVSQICSGCLLILPQFPPGLLISPLTQILQT